MDAVLLARLQFAMTISFHFIFPALTIGLAWLIVWLMNRWRRSGAESDRHVARFWIKLFGISFAMGVATGITMEFQFGTNWAAYSRFVGDIFGAPLAAEAVFAFFLESVFLAVLLFGWKRLSRTVLWFASLMVAVGSTLSAFWIIVANSWMQTPTAFRIVEEPYRRAELTDFWGAVFNPSTLPRFFHTVDACLLTGAFFMLGISAWFLLKNRHVQQARQSFTVALFVALAAALGALALGHWHAVQVAETQPAKLAAFEGLFETRRQAPLMLFGIPDAENRRVIMPIAIPGGLSMLVAFDPNHEVKGLNDIPRDEWPPVLLSFASFHLMVVLGMFFIAFTGLGVLLLWRRKLFDNRLFLWAAVLSIPLPFIATNVGWMAAEVGRQPWIVQGILRTRDAISITVPAGQILASIIMFAAIYTLLFVSWIRFMRRIIRHGIEEPAPAATTEMPSGEVTA